MGTLELETPGRACPSAHPSHLPCATPVGSHPRLRRPRHPIGHPRSTSWKQPSNQQAHACDSRPGASAACRRLATLGGKAISINITFWTLGLSSLALQSWPAANSDILTARPSASWLLTKALSWHQAVGQLLCMALHKHTHTHTHTPRWLVVRQSRSVTLAGPNLLPRLGSPEPSLPRLTFKPPGAASWDVISEMEGRLPWKDRKRGRSDGSRALIWFPSIAPQNVLVRRPRRHETCHGLANGKYSRPSAGVASVAAPGSSCAVQMLHGQETII